MKNTSKVKGRYRFNIIDILLLAVIILSIGGMVFLFLYNGKNDKTEVDDVSAEIIYTVEQKEIPDILRGKINMGDTVIDSESGDVLGQVIDFQYTDSLYTVYDPETNTARQAIYPGKIDVRVKISATAVLEENGVYTIGKKAVITGGELDLRFPFYTGKAVCVSVSGVSK